MKRRDRKLVRNVEVKIREDASALSPEAMAKIKSLIDSAKEEKKVTEPELEHVNG